MRKILAISLALVMLIATVPMALAVSADTSKVSTSITVVGGNRGTIQTNGTDTFTTNTSPNDTGVAIGFDASEFKGKTISKITYTFTGTGTFNQGANYWFVYDDTYAKNPTTIGGSKFQNGKINATTLPSDAVVGSYWQTYKEGKQLVLTGEKLEAAIEKGFSYLYIVHARNSGCVAGNLKVDVEIDYVPESIEPDYNVNLTMSEGASIRLDLVNGLRFTTSVDTDKVAELEAAGATVEYGTLIMPADLVSAEELTLETNVGGVTPIDVVYKADALVNGSQFRGSIVGVKETNIARDFVGRGYVKVTAEDGTETVSYAAAQTRSLKEVATAFAAAGYPGVDDAEVKALVDTWANK